MSTYKLITVHDRYDVNRSTRIRCEEINGNFYCSSRQAIDACRRACIMTGSCLVCDHGTRIFVLGTDRRPIAILEG